MALTFQRAIVVGGSSGIGEALAVQLAQGGAQVAVLGRRRPELDRVVARAPERIRAYPHDVLDPSAVPALWARIAADLGGVDLLVYAAGVLHPVAEGEYDAGKHREMMAVNLLGAVAWMTQAAATFEAARSGTILGISSVAGDRGRRGNPAYTASKAGLSAWLEALRNRCTRYGVNVVTAKPGFVDTAMSRGLKGMFWVISADEAARGALSLAARGDSAVGYVPRRWALVMLIIRNIPSFVFRRLNV